jgi:AcrR family transcriptional regulator
MVGDAQATKRRLLDAAADEFAEHGIAGARVDRIAEAANSNKAQIYHYFESKDGLFDAVFNELCVTTVAETPLDTADLADYAGRLFDGYEANPKVQRLATWHRLERGTTRAPLTTVQASLQDKVDRIAAAQRAGELPEHYPAVELLGLVLHLAALWTSSSPEFGTMLGRLSKAHRRKVITDAVAALLVESR